MGLTDLGVIATLCNHTLCPLCPNNLVFISCLILTKYDILVLQTNYYSNARVTLGVNVMQKTFQVLISTVILSVVHLSAYGDVLQFTADGFSATADTAIWDAVDGNSVMTSVHAVTNDWSLAIKEGGTVFFNNGVSSPLGFPDSATSNVSYAFAVVECAEAVDHATLIDAPCSLRFIPIAFSNDDAYFYESQLTNAVALSINATQTNSFMPTATFQLIEAAFDSPTPLNELYIGGAPATAVWTQSWSGGIAELILLSETPTEEQLNALRRYLAIKYGLAVPTESDGAIVSTLTAMGVDIAGLFNSVFLVR